MSDFLPRRDVKCGNIVLESFHKLQMRMFSIFLQIVSIFTFCGYYYDTYNTDSTYIANTIATQLTEHIRVHLHIAISFFILCHLTPFRALLKRRPQSLQTPFNIIFYNQLFLTYYLQTFSFVFVCLRFRRLKILKVLSLGERFSHF